MANAQVEKLKALGLRHGEKAVVGLAGVLCLLFLFFAATKETIQITPDQVDKDAEAADSRNLEQPAGARRHPRALEEQGIKNPGFEKLVDEQEKDVAQPADFKVGPLLGHPRARRRPDPRHARADRADRAVRLPRPRRRPRLRVERRQAHPGRGEERPGRKHQGAAPEKGPARNREPANVVCQASFFRGDEVSE